MKIASSVLASVIAFVATVAQSSPIPVGKRFMGQGQWRDSEGHNGVYKVETTFANDAITTNYTFEGGARSMSMKTAKISDGFYDLSLGLDRVGTMYCMEVQCHYTVSTGGLEETLTFYNQKLYKLGSKQGQNGVVITWQEQLEDATN